MREKPTDNITVGQLKRMLNNDIVAAARELAVEVSMGRAKLPTIENILDSTIEPKLNLINVLDGLAEQLQLIIEHNQGKVVNPKPTVPPQVTYTGG